MTPREAAEVQAHHRRRLVAAFLTGDPAGRPRSSGWLVGVSGALAAALVAGGRLWPLLHR